MLLSLVATAFLPMTFFTGVFGMNFQIDGGYTMELVNAPYGPTVFYVLCLLVLLTSWLIFLSKGWIEPFFITSLPCGKLFFGSKSSGRMKRYHWIDKVHNMFSRQAQQVGDPTSVEVAKKEEEKRRDEAVRKRQFQHLVSTYNDAHDVRLLN